MADSLLKGSARLDVAAYDEGPILWVCFVHHSPMRCGGPRVNQLILELLQELIEKTDCPPSESVPPQEVLRRGEEMLNARRGLVELLHEAVQETDDLPTQAWPMYERLRLWMHDGWARFVVPRNKRVNAYSLSHAFLMGDRDARDIFRSQRNLRVLYPHFRQR